MDNTDTQIIRVGHVSQSSTKANIQATSAAHEVGQQLATNRQNNPSQ
jgi:hypothetical protein